MMPHCTLGFILPAAFMLDLILGDPPSRPHPVRWMGRAIAALEPHFRKISSHLILSGSLFAGALIGGTWLAIYLAVAAGAAMHPWVGYGIEIIIIYFCIAARSLEEAAMEIQACLVQGSGGRSPQKGGHGRRPGCRKI